VYAQLQEMSLPGGGSLPWSSGQAEQQKVTARGTVRRDRLFLVPTPGKV
jgi:hypothetical protein